MFVFAAFALYVCDFIILVKVRGDELSGFEKSLKDYASKGIRTFLTDSSPFSASAYGARSQPAKSPLLAEEFPAALEQQSNPFGRVTRLTYRVPRQQMVEMDTKTKLSKLLSGIDLSKLSLSYWMSLFYSTEMPNSASTRSPIDKLLPVSFHLPKQYGPLHKERVIENPVKLSSLALSALMEKKVPYIIDSQASKFPVYSNSEYFMNMMRGQKSYRMQEKPAIEKLVPYPVENPVSYPVEKHVPYTEEKHVPYPVEKYVPYPVEKLIPYPVPVPVRTPVEIPVPVPMVKFDPIFIPVRESPIGLQNSGMAAFWRSTGHNLTSTSESKKVNLTNPSNFRITSQTFDEAQAVSSERSHEVSSTSNSYHELPVSNASLPVIQNQLVENNKVDSELAASEKKEDSTEPTSTEPSTSSSP